MWLYGGEDLANVDESTQETVDFARVLLSCVVNLLLLHEQTRLTGFMAVQRHLAGTRWLKDRCGREWDVLAVMLEA
jgi:hypothetical protein